MTSVLLVLALLTAAPILPGECLDVFTLGLDGETTVECPELPCTGPTLITVYPWGRIESCQAGVPLPDDPGLWANFCVSTRICGSEVGEIFSDGFESGDTSRWH